MNGGDALRMGTALLGAILLLVAVNQLADLVYPNAPAPQGVSALAPDAPAAPAQKSAKPAAAAPTLPLPDLLAAADPRQGAKIAQKCHVCHDLGPDSANRTGPGLWGVVGRPIAAHPDFAYSDGLKALAAKDGKWTYAELFDFLRDPRAYVPGSKMTFEGLPSAQDRADVLAFLQTLSDAPVPFPSGKTATIPPAAKAEGG